MFVQDALGATDPADADIADTDPALGPAKRQADDLASIIAALEQNSPEDAAAARAGQAAQKRDEIGDIMVCTIDPLRRYHY